MAFPMIRIKMDLCCNITIIVFDCEEAFRPTATDLSTKPAAQMITNSLVLAASTKLFTVSCSHRADNDIQRHRRR